MSTRSYWYFRDGLYSNAGRFKRLTPEQVEAEDDDCCHVADGRKLKKVKRVAPTPQEDEPSLTARIINAFDAIPRDDPDNTTTTGVPTVAAVEAVLGYDISAHDRDVAWGVFLHNED